MLKKIWRLLEDLEDELRIDLKIDFIEVSTSILSRKTAMFYTEDDGSCVVTIGNGFKGKLLKEVLAHEIGHSLFQSYFIPKYLIKPFLMDDESFGFEDGVLYSISTTVIGCGPFNFDSPNFISAYSRVSWEEDFCETFGHYLVYGIPKRINQNLMAKFHSVQEVIKYLRSQNYKRRKYG